MQTFRVPGSRNYRAVSDAIVNISTAPKLQAQTLAAAQRIRDQAAGMDRLGQYVAQPRTIPSGWRNEPRAGAVVTQVKPGPGAPRRRIMAKVVQDLPLQGGQA